MKRASKLKSSAYAPVSTNLVGQNMVYMHMSSHYRRLMNVKSYVDSSLPPRRRPVSHTLSATSRRQLCENTDTDKTRMFADISATDDYFRESRNSSAHQRSQTKFPTQQLATKRILVQSRPPADLLDQHSGSFEKRGQHFNPRVLKTEAESRVKKLNVYHPPRKRMPTPSRQDLAVTPAPETEPEVSEKIDSGCEDRWIIEDVAVNQLTELVCNECGHGKPRDSSKVSTGSRDSAYNGGTSSGGDSRGPTPEQVPLVKPVAQRVTSAVRRCGSSEYNHRKDDTMYASFSHHITEDILLRGIFSDRGMNAVFQRHIEENKLILDMDRMTKEIAYLRVQLGMEGDNDVSKRDPATRTDMMPSISSYVSKRNTDIICSISDSSVSSDDSENRISSDPNKKHRPVKTDDRFLQGRTSSQHFKTARERDTPKTNSYVTKTNTCLAEDSSSGTKLSTSMRNPRKTEKMHECQPTSLKQEGKFHSKVAHNTVQDRKSSDVLRVSPNDSVTNEYIPKDVTSSNRYSSQNYKIYMESEKPSTRSELEEHNLVPRSTTAIFHMSEGSKHLEFSEACDIDPVSPRSTGARTVHSALGAHVQFNDNDHNSKSNEESISPSYRTAGTSKPNIDGALSDNGPMHSDSSGLFSYIINESQMEIDLDTIRLQRSSEKFEVQSSEQKEKEQHIDESMNSSSSEF